MLGWGTLNESVTVIVNETVMSLSQGSSPVFPWGGGRKKQKIN